MAHSETRLEVRRLPVGPMTQAWLGDNRLSQEIKNDWLKNGFAVMRGAFGAEQVEAHNDAVRRIRADLTDDGKDSFGLGDRIGQLHQLDPSLIELATNAQVLDFLHWALDDTPVLFGSLNFDRGTQQDAHIDAIFFWPEPSYSMAGCWVALEDITLDAGPLFYLPGSHNWPFHTGEEIAAIYPDLAASRAAALDPNVDQAERGKIVSQLGNAWTEVLHQLAAEAGVERRQLELKAGDAVFWHSLLAHGGASRLNPSLSRRSVVYHYLGKHTRLYTFEQFMLINRDALAQQPHQVTELRNYRSKLEYMRFPHFVTYHEGREIVHPL